LASVVATVRHVVAAKLLTATGTSEE